jgi:hypothetical protein
MKKLLLAFAAYAAVSISAHAQQSITTALYSQNFNSYAGSAATMPTGWSATFNGTLAYKGTNAGTTTTGGAYAFGTSPDFSLGAVRSGSADPGITYIGSFTNGTGATITSLTLTWNYEQYRGAGNTSGWDLTGTGALASNAILNAQDFVGATSVSGTTSTSISFTLTGLSIAPGAAFGFSWATTDLGGADNDVGIDDFSMQAVTAVPEPHEYGIAVAALLGFIIVVRRRQKARQA